MRWMALILAMLLIGGCGSGGSTPQGSAGSMTVKDLQTTSNGTQAENTVILKVAAVGNLDGRLISGMNFTLRFPPGVSLDSTADGQVAAGEIVPSGVNVSPEYLMARYLPGRINVAMINSKGFGCGEFMTVTCKRTPGASVTATDFFVEDFQAADYTPVTLRGVAPTVTVDIR